MIQTTPRKPIKVFLQSGENDVHSPFGHWPTANQAMAKALEYAGYDFRFEYGSVATRCDMVERSSQMHSALSGRIRVDPQLPERALVMNRFSFGCLEVDTFGTFLAFHIACINPVNDASGLPPVKPYIVVEVRKVATCSSAYRSARCDRDGNPARWLRLQVLADVCLKGLATGLTHKRGQPVGRPTLRFPSQPRHDHESGPSGNCETHNHRVPPNRTLIR